MAIRHCCRAQRRHAADRSLARWGHAKVSLLSARASLPGWLCAHVCLYAGSLAITSPLSNTLYHLWLPRSASLQRSSITSCVAHNSSFTLSRATAIHLRSASRHDIIAKINASIAASGGELDRCAYVATFSHASINVLPRRTKGGICSSIVLAPTISARAATPPLFRAICAHAAQTNQPLHAIRRQQHVNARRAAASPRAVRCIPYRTAWRITRI